MTIESSVTLESEGVGAGMPASNVAVAIYTMNLPAPTVTPGYRHLHHDTVRHDVVDVSGATIRYTTDGTDPTTSSTAYSSAITIDASTDRQGQVVPDGLGRQSRSRRASTR